MSNEFEEKKDEIIQSNNDLIVNDEAIEDLIDLADDVPSQIRISDNGFKVNEKVLPRLRGILFNPQPYLIKFNGAGTRPERLPYERDREKIPDGFERRCDVKMLISDQEFNLIKTMTPCKPDTLQKNAFARLFHLRSG